MSQNNYSRCDNRKWISFIVIFITFYINGCKEDQSYNLQLKNKINSIWAQYSKYSLSEKQMIEDTEGECSFRLVSKKAIPLKMMDAFFEHVKNELISSNYMQDKEIHDSYIFKGNWYVTSSNGRFLESLFELATEHLDNSKSFTIIRIHNFYRPEYNDGVVITGAGEISRDEFIKGLNNVNSIYNFNTYTTIYIINDFKKYKEIMSKGE